MRYIESTASLVLSSLLLAACSDPARVTDPRAGSLVARASATASVDGSHPVEMLDQCDPETFNAAVGPGTCTSSHPGITFDRFIAQLSERQDAPAWRNAPQNFSTALGTTLVAINRGGEVHTFTRVAVFGGGVVPVLNLLSGTPVPAPECLAAPPSEYIFPGGQDAEVANQSGTLYYQCCIHPWMRTTVNVR
jgi:hypothetical protein